MFIFVTYKDAPELSYIRRRSSETDLAQEKVLLVNPNCPVRVMLEYIRKSCKLASFTVFDLCDETGCLMGLFSLPTYAYATERFVHKKVYYLIVMRQDGDKRASVLPQLNRENKLYQDIKARVKWYLINGEISPMNLSPPGKITPPAPGKVTPPKSTKKK
ncbi:uncharacterized protein CXorf65-like [Amyelois transitella]|uniref:uncharacterized protein CXorf65-like n=1 Tax=Amyelois transitella TaxID=680683 RepID=UPI00067C3FBB|nr:uncharacterized protein CXorf65-like [Amyelois transitella]